MSEYPKITTRYRYDNRNEASGVRFDQAANHCLNIYLNEFTGEVEITAHYSGSAMDKPNGLNGIMSLQPNEARDILTRALAGIPTQEMKQVETLEITDGEGDVWIKAQNGAWVFPEPGFQSKAQAYTQTDGDTLEYVTSTFGIQGKSRYITLEIED